MSNQVSAIARLQALPPLFRGGDLTVRFQWTSKTASHYLYLWKKRGLVRPLGGHSDVYANLLVSPQPHWEKALLMAMPSAVTIGVEALRLAGWTTQVPRRPTVAVNAKHSVFNVDPFEAIARDPLWFEQARGGIQGDRTVGLPVLRPAWALADMLCTDKWGACGLWPDDIDWDVVSEDDEDDWHLACAAFGMPPSPLRAAAMASR